jgi:endonuclease/exonuclease/phosphatase family metal-dependent hydrolase
MGYKVFFSNIGYARGIDGSLWQHVCRANRHLYCSVPLQQEVLQQLKGIIDNEKPDLCCFVELDQGSHHSGGFNQLDFLVDGVYKHFDFADKYGPNSWMGKIPMFRGRSSAFMSQGAVDFKHLYFSLGSKRLIHQVELPAGITLYFTHFSLSAKTRHFQLAEMRKIVQEETGPVIIMADFNIMNGFGELKPLIDGTDLQVLNKETDPTFMLHTYYRTLDLCIVSKSLVDRMSLKIIQQPFSDHAALLAEVN